jgi:uncharacterized protein (TIGR03000 family)
MAPLTHNIRRGGITMLWKLFSFGGPLLLAGALAFVTPDSAQAQHRGGGHSGGFHAGDGHAGGFHTGGFHGHAVSGFHGGGFHHVYPHHGYWGQHYYPHYGYWGHYHHHHYPYYGWYGFYPYYYPYYVFSGSYPSYDDTYPYTWSTPAYDSGYYADYGSRTPSYSDRDLVVTPPNTAHITVSAPPDAEIWFNDSKTTATGSVREFQTPPLTAGSQYAYEVRARWSENGQEVTQKQQVPVAAGVQVRVTFPVESPKARTAPND